MATDHIRYDLITQDALRGVVRTVLMDARKGLPGDHHFFITFDTRAEGVQVSSRLRAQWPQEMTIVLQHQFWDLTVSDVDFEVGLSFGGHSEKLKVPYTAIKSFFDPSVQFGLQFETVPAEGEEASPADAAAPTAKGADANTSKDGGKANGKAAKRPAPALVPANPQESGKSKDIGKDSSNDSSPEPTPPTGGGEIVSLDRFRKKK